MVLGAAGAGKSMLLRDWLVRWAEQPDAFPRVPVLVELSRYNATDSFDELLVESFRRRGVPRPQRFLPRALGSGQLTVFFDGLDEVTAARRETALTGVREFVHTHPDCQVVVTCRDAVYERELRVTIPHEVRVAGFDDAGIRHFLRRWLRRDDPERDVREPVEQMMAALRETPALMQLAQSPLLLTMIASLHDADPGIGPVLSTSRAEFYEQAIDHLLKRDRDLERSGSGRLHVDLDSRGAWD